MSWSYGSKRLSGSHGSAGACRSGRHSRPAGTGRTSGAAGRVPPVRQAHKAPLALTGRPEQPVRLEPQVPRGSKGLPVRLVPRVLRACRVCQDNRESKVLLARRAPRVRQVLRA